MKKEINVLDHANEILNGVKAGALLTTKANGSVNTMTISWGMLGIEWGEPIFITFVREHRMTKGMLDESDSFTVSIPTAGCDKEIARFCGLNSGRDVNKIEKLGLTLNASECVETPGIAEYPIILECEKLYRQAQDPEAIPEDIRLRDYPQDVDWTAPLGNRDYHTAYYGKIVKAYILTDGE